MAPTSASQLGSRHTFAEVPRAALVALLVAAFAIDVFPLPMVLSGGELATRDALLWAFGSILTLAPVFAAAAIPRTNLRVLPSVFTDVLVAPSPLVFAAIVAGVFSALSIGFSYYAYHFSPITADSIAQLFHAHILAHGRLALPADPNPEFFAVDNVISSGRGEWLSQFPIGGPLVLSLGVLAHAPWLIDPLLGGITVAALYHFARRAFGELQGRAFAALFVATPMALLMSASYMNHVPVLCLAALALAALAEWERSETRGRALAFAAAIGAGIGFMATIRPLDALVVATVVGLFQLTVTVRTPHRWSSLAVQIVVGAIAFAPLLYANSVTMNGAFHFGYDAMWGKAHDLGFHVDPHGDVFTPTLALARMAKYVTELDGPGAGWPVPAVIVAILTLLALRRPTRWDALVLGLFVAQLAAYSIYWHDGEFLGPRFLYTVLPMFVILLARAPFLLGERWGPFWRDTLPLAIVVCVALSWIVPTSPYSGRHLVDAVRATRKNFKYDLADAARAANAHNALVFVHEPFSGRLIRRLWHLGFSRSQASELFARGDACSILEAVRAVEADSRIPPTERVAAVNARVVPFVPGPNVVDAPDPSIQISSKASLTPACDAAVDSDFRYGAISFGSALLLEQIRPDGHVGGDVVYVADLDEHNEALRKRFADRTWYRATSAIDAATGQSIAIVTPY